jgi:hypothetical protein
VNDLTLTEYPTPRGRQNPEPPPTCPFIYTNNENEPTPLLPPIFISRGSFNRSGKA